MEGSYKMVRNLTPVLTEHSPSHSLWGWGRLDQGLLGVCAGEERHLVVPAPLAYGDRGAGDVIPPGATLLFDIVIVDVERADARQEEEQRRKQEEEAKRKKKE